MHSYETLALLALVASTASPALSAPVLEGQHQARSDVEERASAIPGGLGDLVKTVGTGLAFGALPAVLGNVLGGNSTRRDLPARIIFDGLPVNTGDSTTDTSTSTTPANIIFDGLPVGVKRGIVDSLVNAVKSTDGIGKVLTNGLIGGIASGAGAVGANALLNNTRREPSPISGSDLSGIGKTIAGTLASLAAADGVKELLTRRDEAESRDIIDAIQLLGRHFDGLSERGIVDSLVNAVKSTDSLGKVLTNGVLGGVASGAGAVGVTELLNNTRRALEELD